MTSAGDDGGASPGRQVSARIGDGDAGVDGRRQVQGIHADRGAGRAADRGDRPARHGGAASFGAAQRQDRHQRSLATLAANDLLERMRANADAVRRQLRKRLRRGRHHFDRLRATSCSAQMAAFDLARWKASLGALPASDGKVG